jgi:FMN phosphatase YigB (HAD superfamily)
LDWTAAIGFPPELWLGIFTSSELRLASPDPEFFSIVLDDLRCDWVEVAYVVSQEKQLLALMDRGLKTIGFQLQPSETFHVHHTINTFNDLSGLLYKLNDYGDTLLHGDY